MASGTNESACTCAIDACLLGRNGSITWCHSTHLFKDYDSMPTELYKDYDSVPTGRVGFSTDAQINCTPHTCLAADRKRLYTHN